VHAIEGNLLQAQAGLSKSARKVAPTILRGERRANDLQAQRKSSWDAHAIRGPDAPPSRLWESFSSTGGPRRPRARPFLRSAFSICHRRPRGGRGRFPLASPGNSASGRAQKQAADSGPIWLSRNAAQELARTPWQKSERARLSDRKRSNVCRSNRPRQGRPGNLVDPQSRSQNRTGPVGNARPRVSVRSGAPDGAIVVGETGHCRRVEGRSDRKGLETRCSAAGRQPPPRAYRTGTS